VRRLYLAGPMTGYPDLNFPAFHKAAASLRASGYEVVNPAELEPDQAALWEDCMRKDIAALVTCDGIALLPGWEKSRGATLEHHIADRLGMRKVFVTVEVA
jgi:nucleoside 2-deoxyribosyltransferase